MTSPAVTVRNKANGNKANASSTGVKKGQSVCPICESAILDAVGKKPGQDAIECEGTCAAWLHRHCAGLSKEAFKMIRHSKSNSPFYCAQCRLEKHELEIESLKSSITSITAKLTMACDELADLKKENLALRVTKSSQATNSYSSVVSGVPTPCPQSADSAHTQTAGSTNKKDYPKQDRKFNLILFGVTECEKGTLRHRRISSDTESVAGILAAVDPDFSAQSLRDSFRLGKYQEERSRPILVKLTRSSDVASVLSKRAKLADLPGISIKADQSLKERAIESQLLKERKRLIALGTERSAIKLRGGHLYVNNSKHGRASESGFELLTLDSNNVSPASPPSSPSPVHAATANRVPDLSPAMTEASGSSTAATFPNPHSPSAECASSIATPNPGKPARCS